MDNFGNKWRKEALISYLDVGKETDFIYIIQKYLYVRIPLLDIYKQSMYIIYRVSKM